MPKNLSGMSNLFISLGFTGAEAESFSREVDGERIRVVWICGFFGGSFGMCVT